ncbi:histone deacetylase 6/10 [[Emmonsia] crescens]|uniref:Histone deacetylase n=1 Tax=[Emmonsia] crescens TaxID=73230 RepID=A0A2B7ZTC4_9EURO|nr:histone deacetylase 6/10 [Emmonsia crescens]
MSTIEENEDVVMSDMAPPTVIPIGPGRPLSGSPEKPPSPLELNGTTAPSAPVAAPAPTPPHAHAPSLMQAFREKFAAPANLVRSVDAPQDHATATTPERKSPQDLKYDSDADSLVEIDSDWPNDSVEDTRGLPLASLATGLCYDIRMRYHCEVKPTLDVHPEDPRRIYYIYKELCKAGLVDDPESSRPLVSQPLQRIGARDATEAEISLVHDPEHYAFVKSTKDMSEEDLIALEHTRDSIYFNSLTFTSSILSCGGAIETCKAVVDRQVKNAIAVIRPPGHHAEHNKTMGFCLFNNVCVAARVCQSEFGEKCRKILILDWYATFSGNGIQKAFYDDPNILYISLHVYRDGSFYPGGDEGNWDHCGEGNGLGKNINIPWPTQGMGDGDYMYAFQEVVMPIAYEFDPDLVIISAGFDAAAGDELGGCFVTPPCYAHMTRMLMNLAGGKVAVCLEGGYNFRSISKSALAVTRTLMGEPPDRLYAASASRPAVHTVKRVAMIQAAYWKCMYPKGPPETFQGNRVHDIIRQYQAKQLYDECKLTNLYIYRDTISKSFENQVLASQNYDKENPLLVIFHDPPELMGIPHPVTNTLEPHNCWLADVVKDYVEWAIQNNFGVIDVNIPKHITSSEKSATYQEDDRARMQMSDQLATYLWENYIEPNDATSIFFLGVGNAYFGLANLLVNTERVHERVSGVISFVAENPVRAVSSNTTTWLSKWYKDNSIVFVSHLHSVWAGPENSRKLSKRYGRLIRSPNRGLNEMLNAHKEDVFKFMVDRLDEEVEE